MIRYVMGDVGNFVNLFWIIAQRRQAAENYLDRINRINKIFLFAF